MKKSGILSEKAIKREKRFLHNIHDKETLQKLLDAETFKRTTLSFYRYTIIDDPQRFRDELYKGFYELGVLGRTYVAKEGFNAQISVPEHNHDKLVAFFNSYTQTKNLRINIAVDDGKSFYKLIVRVRPRLVNDGLYENTYDLQNIGKHLTPDEFNEAMEKKDSIVVDMRNHYESEVGHFENALLPQADTFREELPQVLAMLKGKEEKKILLYCTGGIRCEKASAFLKHHGFNDVNQLYGGVIYYANDVNRKHVYSKFRGKNFVFDARLGERVSTDILSSCHTCGTKSDNHVNCANDQCHRLFIQCDSCAEELEGCCSKECRDYNRLSAAEKKKAHFKKPGFHHSRMPVIQQSTH